MFMVRFFIGFAYIAVFFLQIFYFSLRTYKFLPLFYINIIPQFSFKIKKCQDQKSRHWWQGTKDLNSYLRLLESRMLPLHQSPILESADRLALSHKSFADFHITIFAMLTLAEAVGLAPTTRSSRATRFQDELFI